MFQSMLHQQCLFKASKCHKKNFISIQARGGLYWEEVGQGTYNQKFFLLQEDGLLLGGGGGAYTCNCRRGVIVILEVYSNLPETVKLLKSWHFEN